jgi:hypothetical protein
MSASSWPEAVPAAVTPAVAVDTARWNVATRVAFRFLFVYLGLYNVAFFFQILMAESAYALYLKYMELWNAIVPRVATSVFGVKADVLPNGSGDTTFDYVLVFVYAVVAATATLLWSVADRNRANYRTLFTWFRTYIRFALAVAMIGYGVAKVIPLQFGNVRLDKLMQPLGDSSPMGLLWTFMAFSPAYTIFGGASELLGGILLTMRRTALLGALVTAGVMANVVMLNFSYDVPVKLYSSHLLLMALFIAAPDAVRLARLFVLNQPVEPAELRPRFENAHLDFGLRIARTLFFALVIGLGFKEGWKSWSEWRREPMARAPLYGIWNAETMRIDGIEHPPLLSDAARWRRVIVSSRRIAAVEQMDATRTRFSLMLDRDKQTLTLKQNQDAKAGGTLEYTQPDEATLVVNGVIGGKKIEATLRKAPIPEFLLTSRGFHWINEYPLNR